MATRYAYSDCLEAYLDAEASRQGERRRRRIERRMRGVLGEDVEAALAQVGEPPVAQGAHLEREAREQLDCERERRATTSSSARIIATARS